MNPSINDLLAELKRHWTEIVKIARALPAELLERKNYLWWITFEIDPAQVVVSITIDQLRAALAATG